MDLGVYRDKDGSLEKVGTLDTIDARGGALSFVYESSYLASSNARALSFSLPLQVTPFPEDEFMPYFKGLLPEGPA